MKKIFWLFVYFSMAGLLSAQDTIPFLDPCFCYPDLSHDGIIITLPDIGIGLDCYQYPVEDDNPGLGPENIHSYYYVENFVDSKDGSSTAVYGIAITSDSILPPELTVVLYQLNRTYPIINCPFQPIDSLNCSDLYYHKQMFYTYRWRDPDNPYDTNTYEASVPCHLYLFNHLVNVPDTFYYKTNPIEQPFKICEVSRPYHHNINGVYGTGGYARWYDEVLNSVGYKRFYTWGGIFPILNLPCPSATKPEIVESMQGSVRFTWWAGDTNLYQVAICSYLDTTVLVFTDTLIDNNFHITDSLMSAHNLSEGRYFIRLRRACNYLDSPYQTLIWSPWSDARMFYYSPNPNGISISNSQMPLFSLSPNPATGLVTIEYFGQNEENCINKIEIKDMEGREVSTFNYSHTNIFFFDVSTLSPGVYFVTLTTPAGPTTKKLLIQ